LLFFHVLWLLFGFVQIVESLLLLATQLLLSPLALLLLAFESFGEFLGGLFLFPSDPFILESLFF
jgi:hypothetical protein